MFSIKTHILQGYVNALKTLVSDCDKIPDKLVKEKAENIRN